MPEVRAWCASAALLGAILTLGGCRGNDQAREASPTQTVAGLTGTFLPSPSPARVGHDSGFTLELTEGGQPVRQAGIDLALHFVNMNQAGPTGSMMESAPGRYEVADLSTGMAGRWEARVVVRRPGKPEVAMTFPFSVAR